MIVALLPAHNEAATIAQAIASLQGQGVTNVLVMCDNCTDNTREIATAAGAVARDTVNNTARKSGALNQGLRLIESSQSDLVLCMDADTVLHDGWVGAALAELRDPKVGAVGAVFEADRHDGWLRRCQSLEWERFSNEISRTGKTFVLSGTAALIRWEALQDVRERFGNYYDTSAITEDFDFSVRLLACGWKLRSPLACRVTTETMPTVMDLFRQRRRWSLGAMQTVSRHGLHRHTRVYWRQQAMLLISILAMTLLLITTIAYAALGGLLWSPFWAAIGGIFLIERVVTIPRRSAADKFLAAAVLPELAYALILQAAHVAAIAQFVTGSAGTWGHVKAATA